MNGESARKKSITAFRHVFYERCGFDIPDPDEGSLDDEERGRWDAMCSALDAYEAALRERGYAILPVVPSPRMIAAAIPIMADSEPSESALEIGRAACLLLPPKWFAGDAGIEQAAYMVEDYRAMVGAAKEQR